MARRTERLGFILAMVVFALLPGMSAGQTSNEEVGEKIVAAWKARQDKLGVVYVEWKSTTTIHQGFNSTYNTGRFKPKEIDPPRDYFCPGEGAFRIQDKDIAIRYRTQRWNPFSRAPEDYECAESLRDDSVRLLHNPGHPGCDHPIAVVGSVTDSKVVSNGTILPLTAFLRGVGAAYKNFFQIARWEPTGRTVPIANRPCVEMERKTSEKNVANLLYLDSQRDYVAVRCVTLSSNKPTWVWNAEYAADPQVGWMIQSWEYSARPNGTAMADSGRYQVTRYEIGKPGGPDAYELSFPAGTVVKDYTRGHEFQYIMRDDGSRGGEFSPATKLSYEELKTLPPRTNGWAYLWMSLAAVTFVGSVGGWIWVRLKRTRK